MVVLNGNWELESTSPGVNRWLAELTDPGASSSRLPSALLAVAGRAMRLPPGGSEVAETAQSRVLTRSGRWLVLHGVSLDAATQRRVAVVIEPAHPARIAPLLMAAYGLTEREQELTRLVLHGQSTAEIADDLVISVHTVQQHLKSVFDKTGVRSRRDLVVTKVFLSTTSRGCATTRGAPPSSGRCWADRSRTPARDNGPKAGCVRTARVSQPGRWPTQRSPSRCG